MVFQLKFVYLLHIVLLFNLDYADAFEEEIEKNLAHVWSSSTAESMDVVFRGLWGGYCIHADQMGETRDVRSSILIVSDASQVEEGTTDESVPFHFLPLEFTGRTLLREKSEKTLARITNPVKSIDQVVNLLNVDASSRINKDKIWNYSRIFLSDFMDLESYMQTDESYVGKSRQRIKTSFNEFRSKKYILEPVPRIRPHTMSGHSRVLYKLRVTKDENLVLRVSEKSRTSVDLFCSYKNRLFKM